MKNTDGNTTILVGKDSKNKIKAFFSMRSYDDCKNIIGGVFDSKTGYIEECMLNSKYRRQGIGKILIGKLMETADGHFTDVILVGRNSAIDLYKREGFTSFDTANPTIRKISDIIWSDRNDEAFSTLMSKSLDASDPWWKRINKQLGAIYNIAS